jgi:hypothetical protein
MKMLHVQCWWHTGLPFTWLVRSHNVLQFGVRSTVSGPFSQQSSISPVTVAERSKTCTVIARADAGTVGSSQTQGMDVYYLCCVCVFLCLCTGRGVATSWSPVQGVLPTVLYLVTEVKRKVLWRRPRPELGCRAKGKKSGISSRCVFPRRSGLITPLNFKEVLTYPENRKYQIQ